MTLQVFNILPKSVYPNLVYLKLNISDYVKLECPIGNIYFDDLLELYQLMLLKKWLRMKREKQQFCLIIQHIL